MIFIEVPKNINKQYFIDIFLGIIDILTQDFNYEFKEIRFSQKNFEKEFYSQLSIENQELFERLK